jgi:histidine ammonia-lyase
VLAIELMTAARALDFRAPLRSSPAIAAVRERMRADVPGPGPDRHLAPEIEAMVRLVSSGDLLRCSNVALL